MRGEHAVIPMAMSAQWRYQGRPSRLRNSRKDQVGVVFTMATEIPTTFHVAVAVGHR
jgi:hypothetical protein